MRNLAAFFIFAFFLCVPTAVRASVEAVVIADRAVIWADVQRTAPLGYVTKGKVLTVGENPRYKNQVVAIAVSGRIGYIAMDDISFDENLREKPEERQYKRFKEVARKREGEKIAFVATGFNAQERRDSSAGRTGESWNFIGGTLRGEVPTPTERIGVVFVGEYLYAKNDPETFRTFNLGLGLAVALIDWRYFKLKLEGVGTVVPYLQYESDPLFTLNGYGYGAQGTGVAELIFGDHWGIELTGGVQVLQFNGIDRPKPFKDFSPFFTGSRWSAGVMYRF